MRQRGVGAHFKLHQLQYGTCRRFQGPGLLPDEVLLKRVLHDLGTAGTFPLDGPSFLRQGHAHGSTRDSQTGKRAVQEAVRTGSHRSIQGSINGVGSFSENGAPCDRSAAGGSGAPAEDLINT